MYSIFGMFWFVCFGYFTPSNSGVVNNTCNLYYFSNDRDSINSSDTVMEKIGYSIQELVAKVKDTVLELGLEMTKD